MNAARLVERITDGDVAALATLYDRYGPTGYALALDRCGDARRAERIVQQVFLDLWVDPAGIARPETVGAALLSRIWITATREPDGALNDGLT